MAKTNLLEKAVISEANVCKIYWFLDGYVKDYSLT